MKKIILLALATSSILLGGCTDKAEKEAKPTFMFWCFRKEIVATDYYVQNMETSADANTIQNAIKRLPGYENDTIDLATHTVTVNYQSSTLRKMNIEEAIAQAGFTVNGRPAKKKQPKKPKNS